MGDSTVNSVVDELNHVGFGLWRAIESWHTHATQSLSWNFEALRTQLDSWHCHFFCCHFRKTPTKKSSEARGEEKRERAEGGVWELWSRWTGFHDCWGVRWGQLDIVIIIEKFFYETWTMEYGFLRLERMSFVPGKLHNFLSEFFLKFFNKIYFYYYISILN